MRVGIANNNPDPGFTLVLGTADDLDDLDGAFVAYGTFGAGQTIAGVPGLDLGGTRFLWVPNKAAIRAGQITGDHWSQLNTGNHSVAFGFDSKASGDQSVVVGGEDNSATALKAAIVGGMNNTAAANYSFIGGGGGPIMGDGNNIAIGANYSIIGGGLGNSIAATATNAVIVGGEDNEVQNTYAFIGGGLLNKAFGDHSAVTSGRNNEAHAAGSSVLGGGSNVISATGIDSTIVGGNSNIMDGPYSFTMGTNNTVSSSHGFTFGKNIELTNTADHTIAFGHNAAPVQIITPDAFIVTPGTNVGIGKLDPQTLLHLQDGDLTITDTAAAADIIFDPPGVGYRLHVHQNKFRITNEADTTDFLTVTSTGNVGINQDNPTQKLHINNVMRIDPQAAPPASGCAAAGDYGSIYIDSTIGTGTYSFCMCGANALGAPIWIKINGGGANCS